MVTFVAPGKDIVVAKDLVKRFTDLVAVDGVSFAIKEGEVFGFLGPNGAGKTTTMRMIQCVSPLTSGILTVDDLDVVKDERRIKSILGVAPQEDNLDPDLTVMENLLVYSRYYDIPKAEAATRAERLLGFFQLEAKAATSIEKLSGGMKRRLLLARALLNEPRILILDEPTVGLDPQARHLIWDQLRQLRSRGSTIILTTHYMDEAERLCDRIVIMDNGRILAEGAPKDLVKSHMGDNVVECKLAPGVKECLAGTEGIKAIDVFGDTALVSTDSPQQVIEALLKGCGVESATVRRSTLEDVFLKLTGRTLRE